MSFNQGLIYVDHTNKCNNLDKFNDYWLGGKITYTKETLSIIDSDIFKISFNLLDGKLNIDSSLTMITTLNSIRNLVKEYLIEVE